MMQKIFTIVVTYNGMQRNWIQKCLDSLIASSVKTEIIVIDNNSIDETVDFIKNNYTEINLIVKDNNLGFAKANNIGIKVALDQGADFVFLLNQDAWIEKDTIKNLVIFSVKNPEYGILSPVHLTEDKQYFEKWFIEFFIKYSNITNAYENLYLNKKESYCYDTKFVNAAAWLITRNCIDIVGGFDTLLFKHCGEDDNYCHRALYHNFKIGINTSTTICHDTLTPKNINRDKNISLSVFYANILNNKIVFLKRIFKLIIKFFLLFYLINVIMELRYLMFNIRKIIKSRKNNKIRGGGLKYIHI